MERKKNKPDINENNKYFFFIFDDEKLRILAENEPGC